MANIQYHYGTGRRKSSAARVFLQKGTGNIIVNGLPLDQYMSRETACVVARQPLDLTEMLDKFDDLELVDYGFQYHKDNNFLLSDITCFLLREI